MARTSKHKRKSSWQPFILGDGSFLRPHLSSEDIVYGCDDEEQNTTAPSVTDFRHDIAQFRADERILGSSNENLRSITQDQDQNSALISNAANEAFPRRVETHLPVFPYPHSIRTVHSIAIAQNQKEIFETFGAQLPNSSSMSSENRPSNGTIHFVRHTDGDVSAYQWVEKDLHWLNIGSFSFERRTVEGLLAGKLSHGDRFPQPTSLRNFRALALQQNLVDKAAPPPREIHPPSSSALYNGSASHFTRFDTGHPEQMKSAPNQNPLCTPIVPQHQVTDSAYTLGDSSPANQSDIKQQKWLTSAHRPEPGLQASDGPSKISDESKTFRSSSASDRKMEAQEVHSLPLALNAGGRRSQVDFQCFDPSTNVQARPYRSETGADMHTKSFARSHMTAPDFTPTNAHHGQATLRQSQSIFLPANADSQSRMQAALVELGHKAAQRAGSVSRTVLHDPLAHPVETEPDASELSRYYDTLEQPRSEPQYVADQKSLSNSVLKIAGSDKDAVQNSRATLQRSISAGAIGSERATVPAQSQKANHQSQMKHVSSCNTAETSPHGIIDISNSRVRHGSRFSSNAAENHHSPNNERLGIGKSQILANNVKALKLSSAWGPPLDLSKREDFENGEDSLGMAGAVAQGDEIAAIEANITRRPELSSMAMLLTTGLNNLLDYRPTATGHRGPFAYLGKVPAHCIDDSTHGNESFFDHAT